VCDTDEDDDVDGEEEVDADPEGLLVRDCVDVVVGVSDDVGVCVGSGGGGADPLDEPLLPILLLVAEILFSSLAVIIIVTPLPTFESSLVNIIRR
jgi:hypothetical protein